MNKNIYILGAGGMAREVYQVFIDLRKDKIVKGFLVNVQNINKNIKNKSVKKIDDIREHKNEIELVNGIGSPLRRKLIQELEIKGYRFHTIIHPSSVIGEDVIIGEDVVILGNSVLTTNIIIGKHTIINVNSTISHDCIIGDYVTIAPGVSIAGGVDIGNNSFIGIGSSIIHNVKIGVNTFIGGGSVVVNNIPDNYLAYGNPARPIRKITKKNLLKII